MNARTIILLVVGMTLLEGTVIAQATAAGPKTLKILPFKKLPP